MERVKLLLLAGFVMLSSLAVAQKELNEDLSFIPEDDVEMILNVDEEELIGMRLLEAEVVRGERSREELLQETEQARHLLAQVKAEVSVLEDEINIMHQRIEKMENEELRLMYIIADLSKDNESILAENDAFRNNSGNANEEDQEMIAQNTAEVSSNERKIIKLDSRSTQLTEQINELEESIEDNEELYDRNLELIETFEDVIEANQKMMRAK